MKRDPLPDKQRVFRKALLSRMTEECLLKLFAEGKLSGTLHTCIGQELVGAVLTEWLEPADTLFSNHRGHGHFISRTGDVEGLLAELMGRVSGVCGGWGGSQHLCKSGFFTNGIQGGIVPVATGLAWKARLAKTGGVSLVFIGDGTLGEGAIYEAFNLAARWELPLLVVLEDNGMAQSTRQNETLAGDISARAAGFGLGYRCANTWEWENFHQLAGEAVSAARAGKPQLLHVKTYRLKAHSKGDDTRAAEEVSPYLEKDPLTVWLKTAEGVAMAADVQAEIAAAEARASTSPVSVYSRPINQARALSWQQATVSGERLVKALNRTLHTAMERDPALLLLGEDIESPYGGAFKVTQGLSTKYAERVRNTPISEGAIVGVGTGVSLLGGRALVEIMFGDFLGLAFDQLLNHASKFERMYAGQVTPGVVVRTPMGGRRGYGPTHSQTLDAHFIGVPGLRVLALHNLLDPATLYDPLLTAPAGATLVLENKTLYGAFIVEKLPEGFTRWVSDERFPTVWIRPASERVDVVLIGYGGMATFLVDAVERLFVEHDLVAQVISPMQLSPFDVRPLLPVLKTASAIVVAEEGQGFAGFGAELLAQLAEHGGDHRWRVARVMPPEDLIPSSAAMERDMLPSLDLIVSRAAALFHP